MNSDHQDIKGKVQIALWDSAGNMRAYREVHNAIVNTGRELIAKLFANQQSGKTLKVGVGTSGVEVSPADTIEDREFIAETGIENPAVVVDATANRARFSFSSTFEAAEAIDQLREAGVVFSDADPEVPNLLYNGVTFSVIDKQEGDVLTLNWEITF